MRTLFTSLVCVLWAATAACGGGKNDADPRVIAGGGVGDGAVDGVLNVHAIDSVTDEPVAGAQVLVGEPGEDPIDGTTDSSGLVRFEDGSLHGPTTIAVDASGYPATVWFGANGANVTIPLDPKTQAAVPQAELSGTIDGWDTDVPDPDPQHLILGIVGYSQISQLGAAENELDPPAAVGDLPANACAKSQLGSVCNWRINARTGTVAVTALVFDVDGNGTPNDDSDDTRTLIDFGYKLDTRVEDGIDQSGIRLERVGPGGLTDVDVDLGTLPSGLTESLALLQLKLDPEGLALAGLLQSGEQGPVTIPDLAGPFSDGSYRLVAIAQTTDGDAGPSSAVLVRDITDLSAGVEVGEWLPPATDLAESGGEYSFTPVDGAVFHGADLLAGGEVAWNVALLDGRTSFTLPGLDSAPPTPDQMKVTALDGPLDVRDFSIDEAFDLLERISTQVTAL